MDKKVFLTDPRPDHAGFQMTFGNGCTISVVFGPRTCSDQGKTTAEVAAWKDGRWLAFREGVWVPAQEGEHTMLHHQTPDQVADLIQSLKNF